MVLDWLKTGMFSAEEDPEAKAKRVVAELSDHVLTKSHARHISAKRAMDLGLNVLMLEDDDELQDAVLSVHHMCIHTLSATPALKLIENQNGTAFIQGVTQMVITGVPEQAIGTAALQAPQKPIDFTA